MSSPLVSIFALAAFASANPLPQNSLSPLFIRQDSTPSWRDVKCDFGSLTDISNDPTQQFNDAQVPVAFGTAIDQYKAEGSDIVFSTWLSNFFNGRPALNCGKLESTVALAIDYANCEVTVNCGQHDTPNAPVNSPAGYLIISSMVSLHQHYFSLYKGLMNALTFMNGELGTFTSTFAVQVDQLKSDKIMLDVTMMLFGLVSSGAFNSILKKVPYFKQNGNTLGFFKDDLNVFVTQSINVAKDSMSSINELKVQNTMEAFLSRTVQSWVDAIRQTAWHVFEEDPILLYSNIKNGMMLDVGATNDALDVTEGAQRALYAYITPLAWSLADPRVGAFIATDKDVKGTNGDCKSFDPWATYKDTWTMDGDMFPSVHFCDGPDAYWLVNIKVEQQSNDCARSGPSPGNECIPPSFGRLPGIDKLDGQKWGKLTAEDLTRSAVNSWKRNGNKNGWSSADPSTKEGLDDLYENGINAMGVVNIPVCSFQEAYDNSWPVKDSPNWPCS